MQLPRRALVVGLGESGEAAALALVRRGVAVVAADRAEVDAGRLAAAGVEVRAGTEEVSLLDGVELVVKSPGVPGESPLVRAARAREIPVWSELELGFRLLSAPLVAVTGTNGKTTTRELLATIFREAGLAVATGGNEAVPLSALEGAETLQWVICEVSSFQLEDVHEFRPRVGVLINLEPDHLDRHGTFEAYRAAKLRLFENQLGDDAAVVPRGFGPVPGEGRRIEFAASDPLPAEPLLPGAHNRENAAAASAAARAAGIADDAIARGLERFPGVEHRLELVAEIGDVRYVNDSKATNVAAALRGIAAYDAPLLPILGGSPKGESFEALARALHGRARLALLIGQTAPEIAAALDGAGVRYEDAGTLERAVMRAAELAEPGDVVLLSPACASYDQYSNFRERGRDFRRVVEALR